MWHVCSNFLTDAQKVGQTLSALRGLGPSLHSLPPYGPLNAKELP